MNTDGDEKRDLSGLEQLRHMAASGERPPIAALMDFRLTEVEQGRAVFEGSPGEAVYNPIGTVHGGYAATLLDSACGIAAHSGLAAGQNYTTVELKVAYRRAMTAKTGTVRAEGKIVSLGRRVAFTEARLTDADGRLLTSATSTVLVISAWRDMHGRRDGRERPAGPSGFGMLQGGGPIPSANPASSADRHRRVQPAAEEIEPAPEGPHPHAPSATPFVDTDALRFTAREALDIDRVPGMAAVGRGCRRPLAQAPLQKLVGVAARRPIRSAAFDEAGQQARPDGARRSTARRAFRPGSHHASPCPHPPSAGPVERREGRFEQTTRVDAASHG